MPLMQSAKKQQLKRRRAGSTASLVGCSAVRRNETGTRCGDFHTIGEVGGINELQHGLNAVQRLLCDWRDQCGFGTTGEGDVEQVIMAVLPCY